MTQATDLPTLEQIATHDPFETIDSPWGHIEAWRASTLATGTMGALHQVYDIVRNDAAELEQRAAEIENRKELVQRLCDMVAALTDRVNRLSDALEARHRADAEEAQRQREFSG
jgi:ubiquinone biosynthesis protein UbiJ